MDKVTYIDDLPTLESIAPDSSKFDKYIRNSHQTPSESGMHNNSKIIVSPNDPRAQQQQQHEYFQHQQQLYEAPYDQRPPGNCIDVSDHVHNCPVCSKLYCNDKTIYIVIIVLLTIICILLLKKVLDV